MEALDKRVHEPDREDGNKNRNNSVLTEDEATTHVEYDDLLSSAGGFGLFQVILFVSSLPFYFFGVFSYFSQMFMTEVSPNHWCWIPELENLTAMDRRNLAIPLDADARYGYSQCHAYVANWSEVLTAGQKTNPSWDKQACQHGWEFNLTEIPYPTISSEMGWVCERDSYQAIAQSLFFVGSIFGGFIVGWVADRFGRVPAAVLANMIGCVTGIASVFVRNFIEFAVCRFFMGMSYDSCMMMVYLLLVEYFAPKYRSLAANLPFAVFFTAGVISLPWIALACGHWKVLGLATSIPMGLSLFAIFLLPESPRWLLSKGRVDDAVKKVQTIGRINKTGVPLKLIEQFKQSTEQKHNDNGSIMELLKRPALRKMFILICLDYTCCMIVFDALVRSVGHIGFDYFTSFTLASLTEFPSTVLVAFVLDWTGRKPLTFISLACGCIFSILTALVPLGSPSVACAVLARFFVNMSCNTGMQWAAEMLPTPSRGTGTSIVHICGYVGTVLSPFIVYLDVVAVWLPPIVIAATAAIGAMVSLGLPETARKQIPQTFDEAERLIRTRTLFELPFLYKMKKAKEDARCVNSSFEMD